jgi:hypothetical protein
LIKAARRGTFGVNVVADFDRCFSPAGLAEDMRDAGFVDARLPEDNPRIGFVQSSPCDVSSDPGRVTAWRG